MLKRYLVKLSVLGLLLTSAPSFAALVLYTDRTAWEEAVVNFETEDFNSYTSDTNFGDSSLVFDDFTLSASTGDVTEALIDLPDYESNPGSGDIDGTARVNSNGLDVEDFISLTFDIDLVAFAFDTVNYDINNDRLGAFIGINSIGVFPAERDMTGFIGVIATGGMTFNSIDLVPLQDSSTFNAFDNVSYAAKVEKVSAPAAALLLGGALAMIRLRRKNK